MSNVSKILDFSGFRVMAAWFADYIANKFTTEIERVRSEVSIVNTGSSENVEEIFELFSSPVSFQDDQVEPMEYVFDEYVETDQHPYWWIRSDNERYCTNVRKVTVGDMIYDSDETYSGNTVASMIYPTQGTVAQKWPGDQSTTDHTVYNNIMYV